MALVLLERCCQPMLRNRLARLCQKWCNERANTVASFFPVNDQLRGQFQFKVEEEPWWRRPFGRIYLALEPVDPNAEFAFRVATKRRRIEYANPLGEKDGLARLKRRYLPDEGPAAFWALMDKKTRAFFIANHLIIDKRSAAVQIARSGLFSLLPAALLRRRRDKLLPLWRHIATRALSTSTLSNLAELLRYGADEHLCRTALSQWLTRQPYDPEAYRQLSSPEQAHCPEYWLLWLYCGGSVPASKRQSLLSDQSPDYILLLTTLFERLPSHQRLDICLAAVALPHLTETACRLLGKSQNHAAVPHLIALYHTATHRGPISRGLMIENDERTLIFFRGLLNYRNLETRIQGAYGLAAVGDRGDLEILYDLKNKGRTRVRDALKEPIKRLRERLGIGGEFAGFIAAAQPPEDSGVLSQATLPDLTIVAPTNAPNDPEDEGNATIQSALHRNRCESADND